MNQYGAQILFGCAAVVALLLFVGDNSLSALHSMDERIAAEESYNQRLNREVSELKRSVYRLKKDDRYLEKYARREMGLARANEVIFLFEEPRRFAANGYEELGAPEVTAGDGDGARYLDDSNGDAGDIAAFNGSAVNGSKVLELQPAR